ncbi:MAG TPA: HAMP domain-containing sensor histidine kinase [Trebonia sp.]
MKAGPALRVAVIATLLIACVYATVAVVAFALVSTRLTSKADGRLRDMLADAGRDSAAAVSRSGAAHQDGDADDDTDESPGYLWMIARQADGAWRVTAQSGAAPGLTATVLANPPAPGVPVTADLGSAGSYRLLVARAQAGEVAAGLSRAGDLHTEHLLVNGELAGGPLVLLAMFCGSLVVGMRSLAPVEQARRRQLEFTADASHELRTPLSVLRAEVDVALSAQRPATAYRDSLVRIGSESERLRRLVDDLLWLARFDAHPPPPGHEAVDLTTLATRCADRFRAIGPAITAETSAGPALISAPPEWIDRLMGVLMDNACRYAGAGGQVRISVRAGSGRVALVVEDSGPGAPEAQRARLFDRFQRAEETGGGAGLGLAIGDSIVRSTGGRWRVATSPLGGALMEVSWRHPRKLPG